MIMLSQNIDYKLTNICNTVDKNIIKPANTINN